MNQTKKRLSIIKIAISITDIETIQLQILKLGLLKTDEKIQNIIAVLQAENYAQAQGLITTYLETHTENVLQRSSQGEKQIDTQKEQSSIDEFKLFLSPEENRKKIEIDINDFMGLDLQLPTTKPLPKEKRRETIQEIDINDFLSVAPVIPGKEEEVSERETPHVTTNDFTSLLNMGANDVLADNIDLNTKQKKKDTFFTRPSQSSKIANPASDIPKDTFFDTLEEKTSKEKTSKEKTETLPALSHTLVPKIKGKEREIKTVETAVKESPFFTQDTPEKKDPLQKKVLKEMVAEKDVVGENILQEKEKNPLKDLSPLKSITEETSETYYESIPYIAQKLESMHKQYPSSQRSHKPFPVLSKLLTKISQETYREVEIEKTLGQAKKLMEEKQFSQATQLLLVCAATPSPFAQFILARELYKGVLLTKNIPQAFSILNTLAMDDYPEALCDLGQFYENGIGTKKNKKRAQELYENAMNIGIKRAKTHFERMKKQNKGFFRK